MAKPPRFDAAWNRRRAWNRRWRALRFWLLLALLLGASWWVMRMPASTAHWQQLDRRFTFCAERPSAACVIDGDTVMLDKRRIRLTGYDAPELDGTCIAERQLALAAREALADWLNRGPFLIDGGPNPPRDDYGRELRGARREEGGRDQWLSEWMEERGLARTSGWGDSTHDWCEAVHGVAGEFMGMVKDPGFAIAERV